MPGLDCEYGCLRERKQLRTDGEGEEEGEREEETTTMEDVEGGC